ncbi:MAG: hypothetical protein ABII09_05045 [Planctomycetota bacterium]
MNDEKRNRRLRLLISRLNKERKKQAKQIDILCNDFVAAQKDFIKALRAISFAADFYESIAGVTDLNELLCTAGKLIQDQIQGSNVAFFLLRGGNCEYRQTSFEMHIFESDRPIDLLAPSSVEGEERRIENFFTAELVDNITRSNRVCTIEDMLTMGLQCSGACLDKISAAAAPLSSNSGSPGFILIYRCSQSPLTSDEIHCVAQVASGLARSIIACRAPANAAQPADISSDS